MILSNRRKGVMLTYMSLSIFEVPYGSAFVADTRAGPMHGKEQGTGDPHELWIEWLTNRCREYNRFRYEICFVYTVVQSCKKIVNLSLNKMQRM